MTTHSESRANQLWTSFSAMFGAETLARKYGKTPPREWVDLMGSLTDYELQRGVRRTLASGTENLPSMPKFRRFCQESRNDDVDAPNSPQFTALPSNLASQDAWEINANLRLLKHIMTRLSREPRAYGPVTPYDFKLHRDLGKPNTGSPEQQHSTAILVHWKKHWAQMMREEAVAGEVEGKYQREQWDAYMLQAEQEITANAVPYAPASYAEGILA